MTCLPEDLQRLSERVTARPRPPLEASFPLFTGAAPLLQLAREKVAHGMPSIHCATLYVRAPEEVWAHFNALVDRARVELANLVPEVPRLWRGEPHYYPMLRHYLEAAQRNEGLPWEDVGGLSRMGAVCVLSLALLYAEHEPRRRPEPAPAPPPKQPEPPPGPSAADLALWRKRFGEHQPSQFVIEPEEGE